MKNVQFCYAWDKKNAENDNLRYKKLEALKVFIEKRCHGYINVILDRDLNSPNAVIEEEIASLGDMDLICLFMTPDAKLILEENCEGCRKRRLWREWNYIVTHYSEKERKRLIFPIILEGNDETSLIEEFGKLQVPSYDSLELLLEDEKSRSASAKQKLSALCQNISTSAEANRVIKETHYADVQEAFEKLIAFNDTELLPENCIVDTGHISGVFSQKEYFILGRKGAGKSTFSERLKIANREKKRYKTILKIDADYVGEKSVYEEVYLKYMGDVSEVILDVFWQTFFVLYSIMMVWADSRENFTKYTRRYTFLRTFSDKVRKAFEISEGDLEDPSSLTKKISRVVVSSFALVDVKAMEKLENSAVMTAVYGNSFDCVHILEALFQKKDLKKFFDLLESHEKRILFIFDGLDTLSQDIFESTNESEEKKQEMFLFDSKYYRSLVQTVYRFKKKKVSGDYLAQLAEKLDFCIILPKDKYIEVSRIDPDFKKKKIAELTWSPSSLASLLTKRLEHLIGHTDKEQVCGYGDNIINCFNSVIEYFGIPQDVLMGNNHNISLLNYLLRNSIWRPRDLIRNLKGVMSMLGEVDESGWKAKKIQPDVANELIKYAVKREALETLDETFRELYVLYPNLEEVMKNLKVKNEILPVKNFLEAIKATKSLRREDNKKIYQADETMRIFWEIGAIGLKFDEKVKVKEHLKHSINFCFSAGDAPYQYYLGHRDEEDTKVVINPLFAKIIKVEEYSSWDIIGDWSETYILHYEGV